MNYSGNNLHNKKTTVHFQLSFKGFCYRIALLLKIGSGGINSNPLSKTFMSKAIEITKFFEKTDEVIYSNASKEETGAQIIWNAGIVKLVKESSDMIFLSLQNEICKTSCKENLKDQMI